MSLPSHSMNTSGRSLLDPGDGPSYEPLAAAVNRLGGFVGCRFLRRDGDWLGEEPATEDGLRLPVAGTFAGSTVLAARAQVADLAEDLLHPAERGLMHETGADYLLAVPVLLRSAADSAAGVVLGLKRGALSAATGELERTALALAAWQVAQQWRIAELEQALTAARGRWREFEGESEGLLHSLRSGALVLSPDNRVLEANRTAEVLLEFQIATARGRPVREVIANQEVVEILERVGATGGAELPELRLGARGETVIELRIAPVFDSHGELRRRVVVLNDTTLLKQADELKTEFVSMVSHELRTPLTSIKAFASTLLQDDAGGIEDQREWLRIIDRECDRLAGLISDLLAISRLESGQPLAMQYGEFDLMRMIGEVVDAQRALATRHSFTIAGPRQLQLEADAEKLRQVLANLVNNAVKYSPRGGEVQVRVKPTPAEVEIRVQDEGVGIRQEHLNLIFDKFFQVDGSTTRRVGGTGLGLYLARHLISAHRGQLWAESEPGVGSQFVLRLPRQREQAGAKV